MSTKSTKKWHVTVKHTVNRKTKVVVLPGGLSEAEALRSAAIKAGAYWRAITAHHVDMAAKAAFDRNLDLCLRAV